MPIKEYNHPFRTSEGDNREGIPRGNPTGENRNRKQQQNQPSKISAVVARKRENIKNKNCHNQRRYTGIAAP